MLIVIVSGLLVALLAAVLVTDLLRSAPSLPAVEAPLAAPAQITSDDLYALEARQALAQTTQQQAARSIASDALFALEADQTALQRPAPLSPSGSALHPVPGRYEHVRFLEQNLVLPDGRPALLPPYGEGPDY
jgi:hypothetical protein